MFLCSSFRPGAGSQHLHWHFNFTGCIAETALKSLRLSCGSAHAAGSTDENSLNFITDIFKDSTQPGEIEDATAITAEKNAEWYEKLDFSDRREFANAERGWLDNAEGRMLYYLFDAKIRQNSD